MLDNNKIGRQMALLRKEKGLTGEQLAELLDVSPQAVSKWENGKCLPETTLLPDLAKELGCSIDALLLPRELLILSAVFSDGITHLDVTHTLNSLINGNQLSIVVDKHFLGASIDSERLRILTVKYQTPGGSYYTFAVQNHTLYCDLSQTAFGTDNKFKIIGAYYGNSGDYSCVMQRIEHLEAYQLNELCANHETFQSSTAVNDTEYLTMVYINEKGIHTISCEENESICYNDERTALYVNDNSNCILKDIMILDWGLGIDCTWAGALFAAFRYLGEKTTYEQIMGLSGACYRLSFTDIWDWSAVDALVAFDYSEILFKAIGYEQIWADRIEKRDRITERKKIVADINNSRPVIAVNLRIAQEWGVITGYLENGKWLLCRTYFDNLIFNEHIDEKDFQIETGGYLEADSWPFLIVHIGEKLPNPSPKENLIASLHALADSYYAPQNRGYYQGKEAYAAWINGLTDEKAWTNQEDKNGVFRRMAVNDYMLINLIDARRCAGIYLKESVSLVDGVSQNLLNEIACRYTEISEKLSCFRNKVQMSSKTEIEYNAIKAKGVSSCELRQAEIALLKELLNLESEIATKAQEILSLET